MERFKTLLLREWMQHRIGWLVLLGLPLALFVGGVIVGPVTVNIDGDPMPAKGPLLIAFVAVTSLVVVTLALAWGAALLQTPGLARRDVQDRSIEFWLSLPVSHTQSLAATLLAHLLLLPWAALLVALAGGLLVSLLAVAKGFGLSAWFALPWSQLLPALAMLALRLAAGILLATLWLSPLILGTMAASAWLKRWGVPAVAGVLGIGGLVLAKAYGNDSVFQALAFLGRNAGKALFVASPQREFVVRDPSQIPEALQLMPGWALQDLGHALAALAQPGFLAALAAAAAGFALLWLRRSRGS